MLGTHKPSPIATQDTFPVNREAIIEHVGGADLKHRIAEKLEALVVVAAVFIGIACVGQRFFQKLWALEMMVHSTARSIQPPPKTSSPVYSTTACPGAIARAGA